LKAIFVGHSSRFSSDNRSKKRSFLKSEVPVVEGESRQETGVERYAVGML
jgi:hypothetical protein